MQTMPMRRKSGNASARPYTTLGLVQEEKNPYLTFCGILPKEGTDELCKSLESQRTIDPEFWK